MYIDADGKRHNSYYDYCNSEDLDNDLKILFLWNGKRTPQNEKEERQLTELLEMKKKGLEIEIDFN